MTLAFSYIRFSTPIQKLGRSYDRQMEGCLAWCAKHNMELAEDNFFDSGVSGYSGEHLGERGQLKRFLSLVESGQIPRGSYLVIESLDRLSRQTVNEALPLFMSILNADINIVTLMDGEKVYTKDFTPQDVMMSVFVMARANEESATKAKRALDDWTDKFAKARADKKPVGRQVAKWVGLVDLKDGKGPRYVLNENRASIVERIFRECIAGKGFVAISQGLNRDHIEAFRGKNGWCSSSVDDLLKNRCVLGEWEPKDGKGVIEHYFPPVIDHATWELAQLAMEERRGRKVTKQSANFQVWQQVGFCALCGSTMNLLTKGKGKVEGKDYMYKYLGCSNKRKGLCPQAINVPIEKSEVVLKELLVKVGALGLIQTDAEAITEEIRTVDASIHRQQQLLAQHTAAVRVIGAIPIFYELIAEVSDKIEQLKAERVALDQKHATQVLAQTDKAWLLANLHLETPDERRRANALLRRLGVKVAITGGSNPVYICRQREKPFLQLMSMGDDVIVVPLDEAQREKFKEQDADGKDLAVLDGWLSAKLGIATPKRAEAAKAEPANSEKSKIGDSTG